MTTPAQPDPIICPDCHQTRPPLNLIHQCHGCIGCAVHDQDETTGTPHPGPADELRAAAASLRGGDWRIDQTLTDPIADWLETTAEYCQVSITHPTHVARAVAVARALLGSPGR